MLYHKNILRIFLTNIILMFYSLGVCQNEISTKFPDLKKYNLESDLDYNLKGKILLIDFLAVTSHFTSNYNVPIFLNKIGIKQL